MTRKLLSGVAALALILSAGMASAQDFSAQRLSDSIRVISDDDFQGRYPGTEGETKTLDWLQDQYEAMGLEPGGRDGQWLQPIELIKYTPVADTVRLSWQRAGAEPVALVQGVNLVLRAATNDGQAKIEQAEVVFAGYGITAPERGWDDYGDVDVTGKVVLVVAGEPDGELFNGAYTTNYASGSYKADEAKRRGAVGVITLIPGDAETPAWRRGLGGVARARTLAPGAADLEFSASVRGDVAEAWLPGFADILPTLGKGEFKAAPVESLTLSVEASETQEVLKTNNLLARIPGTTHADETIVFSAHWDHVGVGNHPGDGDKIFNGAWDNASGTVGVVEMARELKAAGPFERSIVFLHVSAEEMGLLGSYAYTADPIYPLETTVANINIDMLPLSGPTKDVAIFGLGQNTLEDDLNVLAEAKGRYVGDDGQPQQGFYYRSDHFPFARAGVPALMPWHGWDLVEGGREAGEAAWKERFGRVYHKPADEWSQDLDFTSAVENLGLLYQLGAKLANSRDWPTWKSTSEFGQVRERSNAARD